MLNWFRKHFGEVAIDEAFATLASEQEEPREPTVGDIIKSLGLRIAHFRPDDVAHQMGLGSSRNTTVVYRPRQDPRHTITVATAVCSENDVFDRKVGAQLALYRFVAGQTVQLPPQVTPESDYSLLEGIFG